MKPKRILALLMAALMLGGCAADIAVDSNRYALALANYPTLTDYTADYNKVAELDAAGWSDYSEVEPYYEAYFNNEAAYYEELSTLRQGAEEACPDLTTFSAETIAALFAQREENTVYSPVNLYMALAMLAECTDGNTRSEILALLGTDDSRTAANAMWRMLYQSGRTVCTPANSMWGGEVIPIRQSLAETLAEYYYADSFTVPMGTPEADQAMQTWINDHTGNLLEDAVKGVRTDPSTVLTLISTLYFKAMWSNDFSESNTYADTFTTADGKECTADFMHEESVGNWHLGDRYVSVSRYFQDGGGSMLFILPNEGISPTELLSDTDTVAEILNAQQEQYTRIQWSVPKFDVDSSMELSEQLSAMGLKDVFDPARSDFSPATDAEGMFLSQVQHAARVTIDENGCTAAAFTVMMTCGSALPPDSVLEFDLDRPFAFIILSDTGLPLFVGTVFEP